jgi:hypothetical protein
LVTSSARTATVVAVGWDAATADVTVFLLPWGVPRPYATPTAA